MPEIEKFLSGITRSLAYTDHIIQFGLKNEHIDIYLYEEQSEDHYSELDLITK